MIRSGGELETTVERIRRFQQQVALLREQETDADNYRLSVGGYLAELDRMNLEVREYLWSHPAESKAAV